MGCRCTKHDTITRTALYEYDGNLQRSITNAARDMKLDLSAIKEADGVILIIDDDDHCVDCLGPIRTGRADEFYTAVSELQPRLGYVHYLTHAEQQFLSRVPQSGMDCALPGESQPIVQFASSYKRANETDVYFAYLRMFVIILHHGMPPLQLALAAGDVESARDRAEFLAGCAASLSVNRISLVFKSIWRVACTICNGRQDPILDHRALQRLGCSEYTLTGQDTSAIASTQQPPQPTSTVPMDSLDTARALYKIGRKEVAACLRVLLFLADLRSKCRAPTALKSRVAFACIAHGIDVATELVLLLDRVWE